MSILFKYLWRNIRANGLRSVIIVFSLALAGAVFYESLNIRQDVADSTLLALQKATSGYDLCIQGDVTESDLPACEKSAAFSLHMGTVNEIPALVLGGDLAQFVSDGTITLDMAAFNFDPAADGQAIMTRTHAAMIGAALGDTVTVETEDGAMELQITAYVDSLGLLAAEKLQTVLSDPAIESAEITVIPEILYFRMAGTPNLILAALEDDSDPELACSQWLSAHPDGQARALYSKDAVEDEGDLQNLEQVITIVLLLVIAMAFYIILSSNTLIVRYRIPVLATFRTLGATGFQTGLLLLAENALCGLVAAIPGMLLGEIFRALVRAQYLPDSTAGPRVLFLLLVPCFTVSVNVLAALFSLLLVSRRSLKHLVLHKQNVSEKPSAFRSILGIVCLAASVVLALLNGSYRLWLLCVEMLLGLLGTGFVVAPVCTLFSRLFSGCAGRLFGGPVWLGVRNLRGSRINRSTALLVASVTALMMVIYVAVGSVTAFFNAYADNYPYDIFVRWTAETAEELSFLSEIDGVDAVSFEYWGISHRTIRDLTSDSADVFDESVQLVANDGFPNGIEAEEGLLENLQDGCAVVDRLFAATNGYSLGDTLEIVDWQENGTSVFSVEIVGFCDASIFLSSRKTIVLSHGDYFRYIQDTPHTVGICTSRDLNEMKLVLQEALFTQTGTIYEVKTSEEYTAGTLNEVYSAMKTVSAIPILMFILALFGLVNNQLVAFRQKRLLYASLYAVGMSHRQLAATMFSELTSAFLAGGIVGIPAALWLTRIMRDILFVCVSYISLSVTSAQVFLVLLLMFLMLSATALFPIYQLRKMDVIREIQYE